MELKIAPIVCDLCKKEIGKKEYLRYLGNNKMIEYNHIYQKWGDKDVCGKCCKILAEARILGLIDFDYDELFIMAGFVKDGDLWKKNA